MQCDYANFIDYFHYHVKGTVSPDFQYYLVISKIKSVPTFLMPIDGLNFFKFFLAILIFKSEVFLHISQHIYDVIVGAV